MEATAECDAELTRRDLLGMAGALASVQRSVEVDLLKVAVECALASGPETLDPDWAALPGRPHLQTYGGSGTPLVTTFAGADFAAQIGKSTYAGDAFIADGLDLVYRLPQLWQRVMRREVQASYARLVARKTRELEPEAAAYVDERVVEAADGRISWSRFEALVDAAIIAADPALAEAREKAARQQQFARASRSTEDGMRGFYLRTDAAGIARLDAAVAYIAEALRQLGCTDDEDTRRAMAMIVLASPADAVQLLAEYAAWRERPADPAPPESEAPTPDPVTAAEGIVADALALFRKHGDSSKLGEKPVIDWGRILPSVTIYVHLYGGRLGPIDSLDRSDSPGLARFEGIGALTEAWLRTHLDLKPGTRLVVRPVIDLEGQAPVDAWEIPERHRRAVRLMTPADVFPWGSATVNQSGGWSNMQIDHTDPWTGVGGESRLGNYGPMTQRHHNLKTHGGWQVQQPFPGIFVWRDPRGDLYLVDHTGTRRIERT